VRTNVERASDAHQTLSQFAVLVDGSSNEFQTDPESVLTDLLTNLMHYCNEEKFNFNELLARGQDHFKAEVAEESN